MDPRRLPSLFLVAHPPAASHKVPSNVSVARSTSSAEHRAVTAHPAPPTLHFLAELPLCHRGWSCDASRAAAARSLAQKPLLYGRVIDSPFSVAEKGTPPRGAPRQAAASLLRHAAAASAPSSVLASPFLRPALPRPVAVPLRLFPTRLLVRTTDRPPPSLPFPTHSPPPRHPFSFLRLLDPPPRPSPPLASFPTPPLPVPPFLPRRSAASSVATRLPPPSSSFHALAAPRHPGRPPPSSPIGRAIATASALRSAGMCRHPRGPWPKPKTPRHNFARVRRAPRRVWKNLARRQQSRRHRVVPASFLPSGCTPSRACRARGGKRGKSPVRGDGPASPV